MKHVLVVFESKYGATAEIAERIAAGLVSAGLEVSLEKAATVQDIDGFEAVVLGSAIYYGRWRKGAVKFLKQFKQDLTSVPVWLFSSGSIGEGDPVEQLDGWQFPPLLQGLADQIKPRDVVVVHGKLDEEKISRLEKKILEAMDSTSGDFRDWRMKDEWAQEIAQGIGEN